MKLTAVWIIAAMALALANAVEVPLTAEQQLPPHIQSLIANHINQVLEHVRHNQRGTVVPHSETTTLVGQVPPLPPVSVPVSTHGQVPQGATAPQVINHQATATLLQSGTPLVHNKVAPSHVEVSVPGQAPLDIAQKVNRLQQHVSLVMQQAQTHIPLAINQAIRERQRIEAATSTTKSPPAHLEHAVPQPNVHVVPLKSGRSLQLPPHVTNIVEQVHQHVPQLINKHIAQQRLGKCNFHCPSPVLPICASNGNCVVEFPGQCELSEWNCFNTENVFHQIHDADCQHPIKCYDLDNM